VPSTGRCRKSTSAARVDQRRPHHACRLQRQRRLDGHYDGQILRYDYSFGDFAVAVSVEQDDNTTAWQVRSVVNPRCNLGTPLSPRDPIWGLGAKYSGMFAGGTFGVGIGYQFTNDGLECRSPVSPVAWPSTAACRQRSTTR
jgi:predicted porin